MRLISIFLALRFAALALPLLLFPRLLVFLSQTQPEGTSFLSKASHHRDQHYDDLTPLEKFLCTQLGLGVTVVMGLCLLAVCPVRATEASALLMVHRPTDTLASHASGLSRTISLYFLAQRYFNFVLVFPSSSNHPSHLHAARFEFVHFIQYSIPCRGFRAHNPLDLGQRRYRCLGMVGRRVRSQRRSP